MLDYIWQILKPFKTEFKKVRAFNWFVIIVVGFILRTDNLGATDVIRALVLPAGCYEPMIHFFRASSWSLYHLRVCWCRTAAAQMPLYRVNGHPILIGDETIQAKEGRRMPGVRKYHQHSQSQSKPEYIWGHMFGCVGVVIGSVEKLACLPLFMLLHGGLRAAADWDEADLSSESHIVQTAQELHMAACCMGESCCALLDRYFLSLPFLREIMKWNEKCQQKVWIITRAKWNAVAYEKAPVKLDGQRGRPRKKGEKITVSDLFRDRTDEFVSAVVEMYDRKQKLEYLCVDLLWGRGLYLPVRFVLVRYGQTRTILVSTDLNLTPTDVIRLYSYRTKIEGTFRTMKQDIGTMVYHFWSKAMEKINRFCKASAPDPLDNVSSSKDREQIMLTVRATEIYVLMSCIAMGILQGISVEWNRYQFMGSLRYQRTPARNRPSEANIKYVLRCGFFSLLDQNPSHALTQIIRRAQSWKKHQHGSDAA